MKTIIRNVSELIVSRTILQIARLICLVGLSLLYPVIEMLDRWDTPGPSTDSEIEIIVLLTFLALIFVLRNVLAKSTWPCQMSVFRSVHSPTMSFAEKLLSTLSSDDPAIPPLLLRI